MMLIRDDRAPAPILTNPPPRPAEVRPSLGPANPDRVLFWCVSCSRSHFVTVDGCPSADEAARETALADGRKAA